MYFLSTLQNLLLNSCCIFEIVATIWIQCSLYFGLDHAPSVAIGPSLNAGWIPWASLNYVQDSVWQQEMDCGITHSLSILLCLWLAPALEPKCENLFLLLRWMVLPPSSVSLVLVVPPHWSKRPEDWEESIFVRHKERGYRLRDNVHFHMYISTSPCGDGRLNSPYEITSDSKNSTCSFPYQHRI